MTPTDWIQAISTFILVGVTGFYAWRTHSLAKATEKQAEASVKMAEAERSALRPIINISNIPLGDGRPFSILYKNLGPGPALNVKFYLAHKSYKFLNKRHMAIVEVGEENRVSIQSEDFNKKDWESLVINCDYESVYGEPFHSGLMFISESETRLYVTS